MKEKFMAAVQEFETEQTGETFLRSFNTIVKQRPKTELKKLTKAKPSVKG